MSKTDKKSKDEFISEVTQAEYDEAMKKGWTDDDIQKPGNHRFRRVSAERVYKPSDVKVRITLEVEGDLLMYFRRRAEQENAESYQTTMNRILRAEMERETAEIDSKSAPVIKDLTKDKKFIRAVAEQVKELIAA